MVRTPHHEDLRCCTDICWSRRHLAGEQGRSGPLPDWWFCRSGAPAGISRGTWLDSSSPGPGATAARRGLRRSGPAPRPGTWHVLQCRAPLPVGLVPATASARHRWAWTAVRGPCPLPA